MKVFNDYSLLDYNTFGIQAKCRRFVEYESVEEAQEIVAGLSAEDNPLLLLGGGSNLLLTRDYDGTVLHSGIVYIEQLDSTHVKCGSGYVWDDFVLYCVTHGLYGAENLSIIPGEVGASAVQNIGAYGAEAKDLIEEIEAVEIATGKIRYIKNDDCMYSYRQSRFKNEWKNRFLITAVTYKLSCDFVPLLDYGNIRAYLKGRGITVPTAMDVRNAIIDIRNAKLPDPKQQGNAGSFFMNPIVDEATFLRLQGEFPNLRYFEVPSSAKSEQIQYKIPAGWMIEQCGWKGRALGNAGVHDKQALVLVNRGNATGNDIVRLMHAVQKDVKDMFGIDIHPEVNIQ